MKKLVLMFTIISIPVFAQAPGIPTKAFDVRNGNGVTDNGTTYPAAIVIPFKNAAAKQKFLDDYADNNNWANANPQPSKQNFALDGLKQWMKEQSINARRSVAQKAVAEPDVSDLPPQ